MISNRAGDVALLVTFQPVFTAQLHQFDSLSVTEKHRETIEREREKKSGLNMNNMAVMLMWMIANSAIFLCLLKPPPSLKTKQCNGQQLCICGKSQTAGLDRSGTDGCMNGGGWR